MSKYYFDKHYEGEFVMKSGKVGKVVTVRLSEEEIEIIKRYSKGRSLSYGLRSILHKIDARESNT